MVLPNSAPTAEGTLIYPSLQGSTNWFSPSYSPETHLFYVAVREMGAYYFKGEAVYKPGGFFAGGGERPLDGDEAWGAVRALNAETGKQVWEFRLKIAALGRSALDRGRISFSEVPTKVTSMRSMPARASHSGTSRQAAASNPTPSASWWTDGNTSPSRPDELCLYLAYNLSRNAVTVDAIAGDAKTV